MHASPLSPVALFELVLLLMALLIPLELLARRIHLPPAAAQILAGMGLAFVPVEHRVALDPDLVLVLFLPPLLMSSAYQTVWRDFRTNLGLIGALAVGAVAFTTAVVGIVTHWVMPSLPWAVCFALGAIVSPPDALAAKAVLQRVSLPARMMVLLEGESLVNDASGLVLFRLAIAAALTGTFSIGAAVTSFVTLSVGGVAIGLLCGWCAMRFLARLGMASLSVSSLLVAWASYILAERLGFSGVLSTVTCGMVIGWRQHEVLTAEARTGTRAIWSAVEFVLESLVFVLIGLALRDVVLPDSGLSIEPLLWPIAAVVAAVILSRFVWMFATGYGPKLFSGRRQFPPVALPLVMGWAGMRGVVSLAIALSVPADLPGRSFILLSTFAVILVTVLIQGSTLAPLIRLLRVNGINMPPGPAMLSELDARIAITNAQLEVIRKLAYDADGTLRHPRLLEQYEYRAAVLERVRASEGGMSGERAAHFDTLVAGVDAARAALIKLHRAGKIHDSVLRTLESELDLEELAHRVRRGTTRE